VRARWDEGITVSSNAPGPALGCVSVTFRQGGDCIVEGSLQVRARGSDMSKSRGVVEGQVRGRPEGELAPVISTKRPNVVVSAHLSVTVNPEAIQVRFPRCHARVLGFQSPWVLGIIGPSPFFLGTCV
jgi:hypothetical protein